VKRRIGKFFYINPHLTLFKTIFHHHHHYHHHQQNSSFHQSQKSTKRSKTPNPNPILLILTMHLKLIASVTMAFATLITSHPTAEVPSGPSATIEYLKALRVAEGLPALPQKRDTSSSGLVPRDCVLDCFSTWCMDTTDKYGGNLAW
jgi:hypothetical protein